MMKGIKKHLHCLQSPIKLSGPAYLVPYCVVEGGSYPAQQNFISFEIAASLTSHFPTQL